MDQTNNEALARALLGNGMAGQAADKKKLYPMYQQAQMDSQINGGQPLPPFDQWAMQFMPQQ